MVLHTTEVEFASLLLWLKFMYLLNVDGQSSGGVQTAWTHLTFEMLSLLVLHQH